jgi:hypothetical protein
MHALLFSFTKHNTLRVEELAGLLLAIGGAVLLIGSMTPMARRGSQWLAGVALVAAGVLWIVALHWGKP